MINLCFTTEANKILQIQGRETKNSILNNILTFK